MEENYYRNKKSMDDVTNYVINKRKEKKKGVDGY